MPRGSKRRIVRSREVGTMTAIATIATAMTGTFTMNTEPHQKWRSSSPPDTGPSATASPDVAAQTAIATVRCFGSVNTLTRMARVAGTISAPPTPIAARQAISSLGPLANAAIADVPAKTTMPIWRRPLRPTRSPRLPAAISRPAKTRT